MTTDPPASEFEDVRIDGWQSRLPSAICTDKEIFNEIFSLETWKTVLTQEQRERILKMLPPEVLKTPGLAEKTIEDLFSKNLTNFGSNPLDTVFDNLVNGHYDPEVAKLKSSIVREWKRESRRLMKQYHTKLLQDIVISREQHLRKLVPLSSPSKKNGKRSVSATSTVTNSNGGVSIKKGAKQESTNGFPGGKEGKVDVKMEESGSYANESSNGAAVPSPDVQGKNKKCRLEAALLSPLDPSKEELLSPQEGPAKKRAKQSQPSKSKAASNKKTKDSAAVILLSPQTSPSTATSQSMNSSLLLGNSSSLPSYEMVTQSGTSLLLGTLTSGSSPLEPPTLSLRSPSSSQSTSMLPPSSLLESLISPSALSTLSKSEGSSSLNKKLFPSPSPSSSTTSSSSSQSFLPSPVQSSPILASQLQAPSPISVNLSTLTGGLGSSRNDSITDSASSSSITLNYTQTPPPSGQTHLKGLMGDDSSSDEFEFESIEPTIGFSGPSTLPSSKSVANIKTLTSSSASAAVSALATPEYKKPSTVSAQELQNIQKCSLLTSCLTQPLVGNSTSTAAVSAALANNILTSTPVPVSTAVLTVGSLGSSTIHHTPQPQNQLSLSQPQTQQQKVLVTTGGLSSSTGPVQQQQQQQQLQKFLSIPSQHTTQKFITQQQLSSVFQQQQQKNNNVICATVTTSAPTSVLQTQVDAQALVNSLMASSPKDLLTTFGASISSIGGTLSTQIQPQQQHQGLQQIQPQPLQQQQHSTSALPQGTVNVNLQQSCPSSSALIQQPQQLQLKQTTFLRTPVSNAGLQTLGGLLQNATGGGLGGLIQQPQQQQQQLQQPAQILSLSTGTGKITAAPQQSTILLNAGAGSSSLNTQSLQLPANILPGCNTNSSLGKTTSLALPSVSSTSSISNLLDSDDLGLSLGSFTLGGMSLDMGVTLPELDTIGGVVGSIDPMKLELECGIDKIDDLSGVLDGNPFDSIPNLSDDLDGLDLDMVDGLCDFEVLLSEEKQYASFFSLIRDVLCSTRDHRMTLVCLEKTIRKWSISPGAGLNPWYIRVHDWNSALIIALNFLAGNYQDVHPEDFVPYIEYKYKTKYYQWIGAGRDGDNNLTPLCTLWLDNLDRLPPLKKADGDGEEAEEEEDENEDSDSACAGEAADSKKKNKRPLTPPPPRCTTDWTVRPSSLEEKEEFRAQEKCRFDNPHKAFTYRMHGYESVVGPVKGVYSSQTGITNKARGHSLLVDDRPPYVTILALVRDAVARLPNGEGTRSEICEMLRDSAFLAPEASNVTLNSVVSGALDRLHYERDPCVRYDSHKKSWIYLHRDRTQEQFERLHHNRSYTKSTKSRNNSSRKSRKSSTKSSSSSSAVSTPATPAPTTIINVNTNTSQSSSSSQASIATVEAVVKPATTSNATSGGIVSTSSGGSVVTLPPVSTLTPKVQSLIPATTETPQTPVLQQQQQQQGGKQSIELISVSAAPSNVQVQNQGVVHQSLAGTLQQQQQQQQTLTTAVSGNRTLVNFPSNTFSVQDASGQQQTQLQPSLNEILAAAAGIRFQPSSSTVVLNQNQVGTTQQGKLHQQTFVQDSGGTTTRLVLQQQPQVGTQQNVAVQQLNQQSAVLVQQQPQQQSQSTPTAGGTIAPGQILLSPSAAVLKLAGNLRLGEGLRFTQLRLPTGISAGATAGNATMPTAATSPLRLPQHRILLTRGALPGQAQTQGVLLGQTSSGQTVILSAGPTGTGTTLAGLQQALNTGGNSGTGSASTGQLALHAQVSQALQNQTVQIDAVTTSAPATLSSVQTQQQQPQQNLQQIQSQSAISPQNIQSFASNKGTQKIGIITNLPSNQSNSLVVSSAGTSTALPSLRTSFTTTRVNPVGPATASTLPPTSIALPASILAPAQPQQGQSMVLGNAVTSMALQSPTNVIVSSAGSLPQQQQQIILTNSNLGSHQQQGSASSQVHQQQQQMNTVQIQAPQNIAALGVPGTVQVQSVAQLKQPQQQSQSFILQPQQNAAQQIQGLTLGQAGQGQLAAPIIIRSAQGEFVSFGIPSNLSLGRGVQGIKVIPFQSGNKTVLARIVAPAPSSGGGNTVVASSSASSPLLVSGGQQHTINLSNALNSSSASSTPTSTGTTLSPVAAQQFMNASSAAAQFGQQSTVFVQSQSQQQQQSLSTATLNSLMAGTVSSNSNIVSSGVGTLTFSATSSAPTTSSISPVSSSVVVNSQSSNNTNVSTSA